jgi:hypothetical protein
MAIAGRRCGRLVAGIHADCRPRSGAAAGLVVSIEKRLSADVLIGTLHLRVRDELQYAMRRSA